MPKIGTSAGNSMTGQSRMDATQPSPTNTRPLTMAALHALSGISRASLSRAINGKLANCTRLPCVKLGRRALVLPQTWENWLRENQR